jgi:adenine phosphoribosyltransferase
MSYLELIDTDTPGRRCDVTPLFSDYEAFSALIEDLLKRFVDTEFDYVVGIDALGFILGTAMALQAEKGFVPVRKYGKLPVKSEFETFVDYTGEEKGLELRAGAIREGDRVLLVDEWVETGAQARAAAELIEKSGGEVVGIAAVNIDDNEKTRPLKERYNCQAVWM